MTNNVLEAAEILTKDNISPTIVHARFIKPLDSKLLLNLANKYDFIVTVEENSIYGGFSTMVTKVLNDKKIHKKILNLSIPDNFITHGAREKLLDNVGLSPQKIAKSIKKMLSK